MACGSEVSGILVDCASLPYGAYYGNVGGGRRGMEGDVLVEGRRGDCVCWCSEEGGLPSARAIPEDIPPGVGDKLLAGDGGVMVPLLALLVGVCNDLLTLTHWTGYINVTLTPYSLILKEIYLTPYSLILKEIY